MIPVLCARALLIGPLLLAASNLKAAEPFDPSIYDLNGNGKIDDGAEAIAALASLNQQLKKEVRAAPIPIARTSKGKRTTKSGLFLGRSLSEVDLLSDIKALTPEEGALFSYSRDFNGNNDTIVAEGALYFGMLSRADENDPRNHPYPENAVDLNEGWLLGTSFNIVDDNKPGRIVDQLNFYGGYQLLAAGGPIDANVFKAWLHHDGDFEFKSSVVSASLEWFPYHAHRALPLNFPQNVFSGYLRYRPKFLLNGQFSSVLDSGDKAELDSIDEVYGIGGEAGLDLWVFSDPISPFGNVDRVPLAHAYVGYKNAWGDLTNGDDYQDLFVAEADYYISNSPNITLTASYKNGTIPYSGEEVELFTVGLGVLLSP
ncbi:hypothetical protein [Pseudorhodoplanes sp.]|uniref:hypothetical protein n=1 Tax=Pseudorhodoplanes sp. TaxID=1934341 RepID=UPI003D117D9D